MLIIQALTGLGYIFLKGSKYCLIFLLYFCHSCSLFSPSCSYHKLLVAQFGSKWERCQEVKQRSAEGQGPIREMEWAADEDLFLNAQNHWADDSPQHLVILHEMFLHATAEGQKEVEGVMHQGYRWHMPQLDPRVDLPAIQLVHPKIGRRELLDLYLEVYKLHWLPGSPLGELAILQEISSAIPGPTSEEEQSPNTQRSSSHRDLCPPEDSHPHWERGRALDRSLARVCKVHPQMLSTVATLEEEIERLRWIKVCSTPEQRPRSGTRQRLERRRKRQHQVSFTYQSTPSQSIKPDMHQGGTGSEDRESDLGDLPELKVEVASFLQGSSETSGDEDLPLELPVSRPTDWV